MTAFRDRVSDLITRHGEQWLEDHINVKFPVDESTFLERLNREVDSIVRDLEASAVYTFSEDEERLSNRVISLLKRAGYDATAETEHRGHVDLLVRGGARWVWLGECKIHGSYEYLNEGLKQLLTRYSTGRSAQGALIIFIKNKKGGDVMSNWEQRVEEERLEYFIAREQDEMFCFRSIHEHQTTGTNFVVRHVGVMLFYEPMDKSAINARGKVS